MQSLKRPTNPLFTLIVSRPKFILSGFFVDDAFTWLASPNDWFSLVKD